jgi:hypothetical protein
LNSRSPVERSNTQRRGSTEDGSNRSASASAAPRCARRGSAGGGGQRQLENLGCDARGRSFLRIDRLTYCFSLNSVQSLNWLRYVSVHRSPPAPTSRARQRQDKRRAQRGQFDSTNSIPPARVGFSAGRGIFIVANKEAAAKT